MNSLKSVAVRIGSADDPALVSGAFGFAVHGGEILLNRQLQRGMLGQFDEGFDSERQRSGDRLVEANGVAQVPEPVLVER